MSITIKACWYIDGNLRGDLSVDEIASVLGVSRYHLSRAFSEYTGQSLSSYARARRLSEAAKRLSAGAPDILTLALEVGYGSHEAFTRAFHQYFGMTPESVRSQANTNGLSLQEPIRMDQPLTQPVAPPRLIEHPALLLFGLAQRYQPQQRPLITAQWDRFLPHFGHIQNQIGMTAYGVVYNGDESGQFDYLAAVEVAAFPAEPAEFTRLRISPQSYAVFEHKEHLSAIGSTWRYIWERGLSEAGLQPADGPSFERYSEEFNGRTGMGGMEIWVPVKR